LFIILMGVSGCGKTTVGQVLAKELDWSFFDGDDYHPQSNVVKMRCGIPLTDEDRRDWLLSLANLISKNLERDDPGVLACSALKQKYRDILNIDPERVRFVYLKGSRELIDERMRQRTGHFMQAGMLYSQLLALEEPHDALTVDIDRSPREIVSFIIEHLQLHRNQL
jgi:gluconokinase